MIALDLALTKGTITEEFYFDMIEKMKELPAKVEKSLKTTKISNRIQKKSKTSTALSI